MSNRLLSPELDPFPYKASFDNGRASGGSISMTGYRLGSNSCLGEIIADGFKLSLRVKIFSALLRCEIRLLATELDPEVESFFSKFPRRAARVNRSLRRVLENCGNILCIFPRRSRLCC